MSDPPGALVNSRRRYEKRTYTPLVVDAPEQGDTTNALGLSALVRALMISGDEFTELQRRLAANPGPLAAATAMQAMTAAVSASGVLKASSQLAALPVSDVVSVSDALGQIRGAAATTLSRGLQNLYDRYSMERPTQPMRTMTAVHQQVDPAVAALRAAEAPAAPAAPARPGEAAAEAPKNAATQLPAAAKTVALHIPAAATSVPQAAALSLGALVRPAVRQALNSDQSGILATALGAPLATQAPNVLDWAKLHAGEAFRGLVTAARSYAASAATDAAAVTDAVSILWRLQLLPQLFAQALTERPLQPIGLLHLERLDITPLAVERGELTYSLPLAPNEKVTLAHREWSVREEQFTDFIEDQLTNFSQVGVTQSTDLAMSSTTQTSHDNTLNMSQPVASANAVTVTGAVDTTAGGGSSVNDATSQEQDKDQSRAVTATASTRTMKDHKVSFTVTTVSGTEDFTAHLIENKHEDKSMRIDYYKRVRNWRSDLYRYGVRLTYDVVLPDPGADLRARVDELQAIQDQLSSEFQFYLVPSDVQLSNWEQLADAYGVQLPSPPDPVRQIETTQQVVYTTAYDEVTAADGSKWREYHRVLSLTSTVPDGFQLENLNVYASIDSWLNVPNYGGWVNAYAGQSVTLQCRRVRTRRLTWTRARRRSRAMGSSPLFSECRSRRAGCSDSPPLSRLPKRQWRNGGWPAGPPSVPRRRPATRCTAVTCVISRARCNVSSLRMTQSGSVDWNGKQSCARCWSGDSLGSRTRTACYRISRHLGRWTREPGSR